MEKLKIYNEVSEFRVPRKALLRVFERFLKSERGLSGLNVTVVFIGEKKMQELNETWKGGTGPTDVLTFDYGDIYICKKVAERNAKADCIPVVIEILNLFAHGLLHLKGYTHETDKKYAIMMEKMKKIVD